VKVIWKGRERHGKIGNRGKGKWSRPALKTYSEIIEGNHNNNNI
jgi:hypothetical protein